MANSCLLLVDGDAKSLRVLEVSLKKAGFNILTASTGIDALQRATDCTPDLVISDTDMLEMNGYAFCKEFKQNSDWAAIPFIFLTKESSIENKIKGLELGVDDYLTKPIYIKEILTRVRILLQKRERSHVELKKEHNTRFAGQLNDMGVVDLIQTIEISRKTGVIYFKQDDKRQATIFFKDGKVIDAETGHLAGAEAVYRILTWNKGEFEALFRPIRRRDVVEMSSQALLMEGMRRLDEWGRLQEQLPPMNKKFEIAYEELWERLAELPDDLNTVLRLFDTRKTLSEVVDGSTMGDLEVVEIISKLYFEGLIIEVGAENPAVVTDFARARSNHREQPLEADPVADDPGTEFEEWNEPEKDEFPAGSDVDLATAAAIAVHNSDRDKTETLEDDKVGALSEEGDSQGDGPVLGEPATSSTSDLLDQAIIAATPIPKEDSAPTEVTLAQMRLVKKSLGPVAAIEIGPKPKNEDSEEERDVRTESSDEKDESLASGPAPTDADLEVQAPNPTDEKPILDSVPDAIEFDGDYGEGQQNTQSFPAAPTTKDPSREMMSVSGAITSPDIKASDNIEGDSSLSTVAESPSAEQAPEETKAETTLPVRRDEDEKKGGIPLWFIVAGVAAAALAFFVVRPSSSSKEGGAHSATAKDAGSQAASGVEPLKDAGAIAIRPSDARVRTIHAADASPKAVIQTPTAIDAGPARTTEKEREVQVQLLIKSARRAKQTGDRFESLQIIDESLALRKSSTALLFKAELLMEIGDSKSAAKVVDQLTRVASRRPKVWRLKGHVAKKNGDTAIARSAYARYLEMSPSAKDAPEIRKILQGL